MDSNQVARTYSYDTNGHLTSVETADGGITTFHYDFTAGGLLYLSSISEPGGRTVTLNVDAAGENLTGIIDVDGSSRAFNYVADVSNLLNRDRWGVYDASFSYGSAGELTGIDRGLGSVYIVQAAVSEGLGQPVAIALEPAAFIIDPLSHPTTYTLDLRGRGLTMTTADGAMQAWERDSAGLATAYADALTRVTTYGYSDGDLTSILYAEGSSVSYEYDPIFHQLTASTDENGHRTDFYLNSHGDVEGKRDAEGKLTTYIWSNGLLQSEQDARGNVTTYLYDTRRRLRSVEDALHFVTLYDYDNAGNLAAVQNARSYITYTVYDSSNRRISETTPAGAVTTYSYLASGLIDYTINPRGAKTQYGYDQRGWTTCIIEAKDTADQRTSTRAYDVAGNLRAQTTGFSAISGYAHPETTVYGYDVMNRLTSVGEGAVPSGSGYVFARLTGYHYDDAGRVDFMTDGRGTVTAYHYDLRDRTIEVIEGYNRTGLTRTTITDYDDAGNVVLRIDPMDQWTQYEYDGLNRLTLVAEAVGTPEERYTVTHYDAVGNVSETTDPMGVHTVYAYDAANRRFSATEAVGTLEERTTIYLHDGVGNISRVINPRGISSSYAYDPDNRLEQTIAGNLRYAEPTTAITPINYNTSLVVLGSADASATTITHYNEAGNIYETIDAAGSRNFYIYDYLNRQTAAYQAFNSLTAYGSLTTMAYDAQDNLILQTEGQSNSFQQNVSVTSYGYDALNRRTSMTLAATATLAQLGHASPVTTYGYDANDNLISVIDPRGVQTYTEFDWLNRRTIVQENADQLYGTDDRSTRYTYDLGDNLLTVTDPRGVVTSFGYDNLNRRTSVTQASSHPGTVLDYTSPVTTTVFDKNNNVVQVTNPLNVVTINTYDSLNRRIALVEAAGTADARMTTYVYDNADNVTSIRAVSPFPNLLPL